MSADELDPAILAQLAQLDREPLDADKAAMSCAVAWCAGWPGSHEDPIALHTSSDEFFPALGGHGHYVREGDAGPAQYHLTIQLDGFTDAEGRPLNGLTPQGLRELACELQALAEHLRARAGLLERAGDDATLWKLLATARPR